MLGLPHLEQLLGQFLQCSASLSGGQQSCALLQPLLSVMASSLSSSVSSQIFSDTLADPVMLPKHWQFCGWHIGSFEDSYLHPNSAPHSELFIYLNCIDCGLPDAVSQQLHHPSCVLYPSPGLTETAGLQSQPLPWTEAFRIALLKQHMEMVWEGPNCHRPVIALHLNTV